MIKVLVLSVFKFYLLGFFFFFHLYGVHLSECMPEGCVFGGGYPQSSDKGVRSPGLELQVGVKCPIWVLGLKLGLWQSSKHS